LLDPRFEEIESDTSKLTVNGQRELDNINTIDERDNQQLSHHSGPVEEKEGSIPLRDSPHDISPIVINQLEDHRTTAPGSEFGTQPNAIAFMESVSREMADGGINCPVVIPNASDFDSIAIHKTDHRILLSICSGWMVVVLAVIFHVIVICFAIYLARL